MADFTLGPTLFPVGTTVGVYDRKILIREQGGPVGAQITSGVVGSDQKVTFTGLAYGADFHAAASVGGTWQKVAFSTAADPALSSDVAGLNTRTNALEGDSASHAASIAIRKEAMPSLKDPEFGASGNGGDSIAADTAAITAWNASAKKATFVPPGDYRPTSQIIGGNGRRLEGEGGVLRWRSGTLPTIFRYAGAEAAVKIQPGPSANRESFELVGLHFDGTGATGNVDGLLLDGSATPGDVYVEGVLVERCAFTNFPRNQIRKLGLVFDTTFRRVAANNKDRAADHIIEHVISGSTAPLITTYDDCFIAQYTAGKWCFIGASAVKAFSRFIGGTIAPYNATTGAHGIRQLAGGLYIAGTHLEGLASIPNQIGVEYAGGLGAIIDPSYCGLFAKGVIIGNAAIPSASAVNARIGGHCGENSVADIQIVAGGSRKGTIIMCGGNPNGTPTPPLVQDDRLTNDGIADVLNLAGQNTAWPNAQLTLPPVQLAGFNGDGYVEFKEQAVATPAPAANRARLWSRDNGAGKTQLVAVFPSGVAQVIATEP